MLGKGTVVITIGIQGLIRRMHQRRANRQGRAFHGINQRVIRILAQFDIETPIERNRRGRVCPRHCQQPRACAFQPRNIVQIQRIIIIQPE